MFEVVKKLLLIPALLCCLCVFAQDSLMVAHQPPTISANNKTRLYLATAASVVGYGGSLVALSNVWYKKYAQSSFHFFNDNNDWLQMDKAGHFFSAYTAGRFSMEAWKWAGASRKQSIWIGGLSGTAFLTVIEILDGFSAEWGFSPGDMLANLTGSATFISQQLAWDEQRIQIKFSFHRIDYGDASLNQRADQLFGNRLVERMLKDYNGQTYWVSVNLKSFFKQSHLPSWLNISLGYGADGMFGGSSNTAKDNNGNIIFSRQDISRYRQWYIAPDIDLTRIRTKSKFLRTTFYLFNSIKFPTPSIGFSKKGVEWNWIHF